VVWRLVAGQFDDVMSWVRATYSRRQLVFSLVESSNTDEDLSVEMIVDCSPASTADSSTRHKTASRRRNASLKVNYFTVFRLFTLL